MDNSIQKTILYRYFDSEDRLLYVGITGDNTKRQSQHRRNSFWFGEIATANFEHYETREEALEAETLAIQNEKPMHNIQKGFVIQHSPYVHLVYLSGRPDGGHDQLHREFVEHYQELFWSANGNMPNADCVITFAMHFTYVKYPGLPNFARCENCQKAMDSDWYKQAFKQMGKIKK